jgi:hypothetical protein
VALNFHNHFTEQPGKHCNVCQTMHSPGHTPGIAPYTPILIVQGTLPINEDAAPRTFLVSTSSERAPPSL